MFAFEECGFNVVTKEHLLFSYYGMECRASLFQCFSSKFSESCMAIAYLQKLYLRNVKHLKIMYCSPGESCLRFLFFNYMAQKVRPQLDKYLLCGISELTNMFSNLSQSASGYSFNLAVKCHALKVQLNISLIAHSKHPLNQFQILDWRNFFSVKAPCLNLTD